MLKKILISFALIFIFALSSVTLPECIGLLPVNEAQAQASDLDSAGFMFDLSTITHEDIEGSTKQKWIRGGINYIFERIISVMAATIGGLAVLLMSYGGFLILSSAGNENQSQKGKGYIKYALIGLAFTLGAYILVTAVQLLIRSIYA